MTLHITWWDADLVQKALAAGETITVKSTRGEMLGEVVASTNDDAAYRTLADLINLRAAARRVVKTFANEPPVIRDLQAAIDATQPPYPGRNEETP